jgi:hypothetical protein
MKQRLGLPEGGDDFDTAFLQRAYGEGHPVPAGIALPTRAPVSSFKYHRPRGLPPEKKSPRAELPPVAFPAVARKFPGPGLRTASGLAGPGFDLGRL